MGRSVLLLFFRPMTGASGGRYRGAFWRIFGFVGSLNSSGFCNYFLH